MRCGFLAWNVGKGLIGIWLCRFFSLIECGEIFQMKEARVINEDLRRALGQEKMLPG